MQDESKDRSKADPEDRSNESPSSEKGLLDRAKETADELAAKAEPILEKAKERAGPALDKAKPVIDQTAERADRLVEKAKPAVGRAMDAAEDLLGKARTLLRPEGEPSTSGRGSTDVPPGEMGTGAATDDGAKSGDDA